MNGDRYQVLILDDDMALGELLREFLETAQSCQVEYVSHVDDFWQRIDSRYFDIIFLDYRMPEANGLEVLSAMVERGIDVPTVMMTGEGSEQVAARAIQSGAFDYLVKSELSFTALPALIQKAVRQRDLQRAMQQYLQQTRFQAALLDNMRDAVVVWDAQGHITYWNHAAETLYGLRSADCVGKAVYDVYFDRFDPPLRPGDLSPGSGLQLEHRYRHPAGDSIWISTHITPLIVAKGLTADTQEQAPFGFMDVARDVSPRKLEQEALQKSRQFVQHILDASPNIIYILELKSRRLEYLNPQVQAILGYTDDTFLNKPFALFQNYLHPDDLAGVEDHFLALSRLQDGEVAETACRFMSSSMEWRWLRIRATVFSRDENRRPAEIIGVMQDITSSKLAEERLKQRLERERLLSTISNRFLNAESSQTDAVLNDALVEVGRHLHMDYALVLLLEGGQLIPQHLALIPTGRQPRQQLNAAHLAGRQFGWLRDRMAASEPVLLNSIADLPPAAEDERALVAFMGSGPASFLPMMYNKRLFGVLAFGSVHPGSARGDDHLHLLKSFSELVTNALAHRQVDDALRLSEARYRAIVDDHQTEMICRFLIDGTLTFVNEAYCRYYHQDRAQLIGTNFLAHVVDEDHAQVREQLGAHNEQQRVIVFEQRVQAGGETCWQEWTTRAIHDGAQDVLEIQAVGRDITERKRMEEQLQTAQTHLTQTVRLASIGELASGVAHQISNPLTTIIADAQILQHMLDPQHPGRESADAIVAAGWRAQDVINALMKFSQPAQNLHETVSINDTIEKALLLASAHIHAFGIKLIVELTEDLPDITANPRQLTDLWVNLLLLARSACDDGGKHFIRIRSRRIKETMVVVDVTDDGRPIPRDQFETVFEPKMQPAGTGRGTGMELSLCREMVRQNQGKITVSGNGVETTFRVIFSTEGTV